MARKPNFLYIMTDQHRFDWLGCSGHPVVKTPNIDALAAQGTLFEQFHIATPVCMPNRASFMTGRYPSVHGLRYNGCLLPQRANTFVEVLKASGYRTASIGKSHLQPFSDYPADDWSKTETGPIAEAWKPDAMPYDREEPDRYRSDGYYDFPTPYYGFDHVDVVTGHGDRAGGHYQQWFRQKHTNWQELTDPANELPHNYTCPQAYRTPIPEDSYPTAFIRDKAKEYLRVEANSDDPFFAFVSFGDPHHPFNPPGKYWDMYNPDDFDLNVRFEDHKNPPPPLMDAKRAYGEGEGQKTLQTAFMASDQNVREAMALTAGMITMIDDAVGEIVAELKASGQYDNTVIIFNSDHGDYMGDFNMMLKGAWAHHSINRVPMIWSDPQDRSPSVTSVLASTIDISTSILDRADIAPYFGIQGRSFLNAMKTDDRLRHSLLIEYNDGMPRMGFSTPARVRTVVSPQWQLTVYKGLDWGELYDRIDDPHQTNNLWDSDDHMHIRAELFEDMTQHLIAQMDESPRSNRRA
ncbi:MAG: sulfatase family protein [Rhizobiaceae bacterium]